MKNTLVIRQNSSEQSIVQIRYKFSHTETVLAIEIETDAATYKCFKALFITRDNNLLYRLRLVNLKLMLNKKSVPAFD